MIELDPWQMFWTQQAYREGLGEVVYSSDEAQRWMGGLAGHAVVTGHPEVSSRPDIMHPVKPLKQRPSECMQTAAAMLLTAHDIARDADTVVRHVPVYERNGKKIGTAPGHIGAYMIRSGLDIMAYTGDTELFPSLPPGARSIRPDPGETVRQMQRRLGGISPNHWLAAFGEPVVDGWQQFVEAGGTFRLTRISEPLLYGLFGHGPYLAMVSSTMLSNRGRRVWDTAEGCLVPNDIEGKSSTHGVVCAGYQNDHFMIADPHPPGQEDFMRSVTPDAFLEAVTGAVTQSANLLLVPSAGNKLPDAGAFFIA